MSTDTQNKAIEKVRPLNATQTRNLEKLVKEDFMVLEQDLRMKAAKERYEAIEQAKADADPERQEELKEEAFEVIREAQSKLRAIDARCYALGLTMRAPSLNEERIQFNDSRLATKISQIEKQSAQQLELALTLLARERSKVQRKVLIASITASTEDVLNTLPTAQDLFEQAVEEITSERAEIEARAKVFHQGQWMDREYARQRGYKGP